MAAFEYAKVYRAGSLTVPHNTNTLVPFTSAPHDPGGYWDGSTRLIVPVGRGGVPFLIWANTFAADQPSPDGSIQPLVNAAGLTDGIIQFIRASEQAGGYGLDWLGTPPTVQTLADGDAVTLQLWQDSSGNGNADMHFDYTTLTLLRLST